MGFKRVNTVGWNTGVFLTRLIGELQVELMKWQKDCAREDPSNPGFYVPVSGITTLDGDRSVIIAAINLRNKLNEVIDRSGKAQKLEEKAKG